MVLNWWKYSTKITESSSRYTLYSHFSELTFSWFLVLTAMHADPVRYHMDSFPVKEKGRSSLLSCGRNNFKNCFHRKTNYTALYNFAQEKYAFSEQILVRFKSEQERLNDILQQMIKNPTIFILVHLRKVFAWSSLQVHLYILYNKFILPHTNTAIFSKCLTWKLKSYLQCTPARLILEKDKQLRF